ncbi:MAG: LacI family DNA-binding transcriptional regulator [Firmicutes bacterium]|nr:LacI family DNA-binding transcriptional regulator [Bacillota bacterium]
MTKKDTITILEIAKMSGVNPSTVSRVINHPEMVNEKTRERVLSFINDYNYRPNPFARGLQTKRSKIVALVVPNFTTLSFANIARGIQERLMQSDYTMVIFSSHEDEELEKKICKKISELHIDGVIFASSMMPNYNELSYGIAKVFIDRDGSRDGIDTFILDLEGAFDKLIKYLVAKGHKNIGFVVGDKESYAGLKKISAFQKAINKYGLIVDEKKIVGALWSSKEGWNATIKLLEGKDLPSVIIAGSDTLGIGVIGAINSKGLLVPGDISVVGFNNEPGSESMNPPLTTMEYDDYGMGKEVAEAIIRRINNPEGISETKTYTMDIIERKTVR